MNPAEKIRQKRRLMKKLQQKEREKAAILANAERRFKKSEHEINEARESLQEKLREELGPVLAAHPGGVDLEASLAGWAGTKANDESRRVILRELRHVATEIGTADVPGGTVVDFGVSYDEPPNESGDGWLPTEADERMSFGEALKGWQENLAGKRDVTHAPLDERRRDELRAFFEETGSVLVIDGSDKIVGAVIRDEERWQAIFVEDLDEKVPHNLTNRSERMAFGWQTIAAGRVVSWRVARPGEVRRFTRRGDKERLIHALSTVLADLPETYPKGIDAARSIDRTLAPFGPDVGGIDQLRRDFVNRGVPDVPGGSVVDLIDVSEFLVPIEDDDLVEAARRLARELVWPPSLTSARNVEVAMMSMIEFKHACGMTNADGETLKKFIATQQTLAQDPVAGKFGARFRLLMNAFSGSADSSIEERYARTAYEFMIGWRRSTFARLEVGHKLAASLCLTDVHDLKEKGVDVRAPWEAWSLVVPDGLLDDAARVWLIGTEPAWLVRSNGSVELWAEAKLSEADRDMLLSLAIGSCLALSNPEEFKKEGASGRNGSSGSKRKRGEPEQVRYLLSAPVQIDLRERVKEARSGKGGGPMKVQSLTRGHWRNQAWGPRHSLRRPTWIRPFFRGGETAAMLLRTHKVEE